MTGRIFDIQRFSLHDGPGIRTTVFFKGCNLHCYWCHNPESISAQSEIQHYPDKCIHCGQCLKRCTHGALSTGAAGIVIDRTRCVGCGDCTKECYAGALVLAGRDATADEVMQTVLRDRTFYDTSGGGVTFSGGEPMLQHDFLKVLLDLCKENGIHTAIETAGNVPWEWLDDLLGLVGLFLFDVKHTDNEAHRKGTGVGCDTIQRNLEELLRRGARVWARIPVIPGFNADRNSMGGIAARLALLHGIEKIELMPFHKLGTSKSESLGKEYVARGCVLPSPEELKGYAALFAVHGLPIENK